MRVQKSKQKKISVLISEKKTPSAFKKNEVMNIE
jgi:hypothetical protein